MFDREIKPDFINLTGSAVTMNNSLNSIDMKQQTFDQTFPSSILKTTSNTINPQLTMQNDMATAAAAAYSLNQTEQ